MTWGTYPVKRSGINVIFNNNYTTFVQVFLNYYTISQTLMSAIERQGNPNPFT